MWGLGAWVCSKVWGAGGGGLFAVSVGNPKQKQLSRLAALHGEHLGIAHQLAIAFPQCEMLISKLQPEMPISNHLRKQKQVGISSNPRVETFG